ncbi:response regulator transcription factor, partial [Acinetobacter baumannii]
RILIADDHTLYREGLRTLLEGSAAFAVIGEAANGRMLVEMVETNPPDVVLTDIVMPIMDGLSAIQQIHQTHPEIALIALTMF